MVGFNNISSRRVGPSDPVRHYMMSRMLEKGLSATKIGEIFQISRQAVMFQIQNYGMAPYSHVVENLLILEKSMRDDSSASQVIRDAMSSILSMDKALKDEANSNLQKVA